MMHVAYGTETEHAAKLRTGLAAIGPNFVASICWWCDGATQRKFEHCTVCGKGRFYGSALGLLIHNEPAPESVVNQVLVAAEMAEADAEDPCKTHDAEGMPILETSMSTAERGNVMTKPATDEQVQELERLLSKTTPGPWHEDGYNDKSSGTSYRIAQVMCPDSMPSGKPIEQRGSVVVCDTLNAHFMFTEDERYHNMEFVVQAHELLPAVLLRLREAEQRAEKWFAKACEQQALRMVHEAGEASARCDCGASEGGTKWGGVHTADCASVKGGFAALTAGDRQP